MDGKRHAKGFYYVMALPLLILLLYFNMYEFMPLALVSVLVYDPDDDNRLFGGRFHRSFITHSLIWCIIITGVFYWFDLNLFMAGVFVSSFPMAIHLFLDLFSPDEGKYKLFRMAHKRTGKYRVKFFHKRLSAGATITWFILNIMILVVYDVGYLLTL